MLHLFALTLACGLAFAQSQQQSIMQSLARAPEVEMWKQAAAGNSEAIRRLALNDVENLLCALPMHAGKCKGSWMFEDGHSPTSYEHGLIVEFARIKVRSIEEYNRQYAAKLLQINELIASCQSNKARLFRDNFTDTCHEKVECRGEKADQLMALVQATTSDAFLTTPREIPAAELATLGADQAFVDATRLAVHRRSTVSTKTSSRNVQVNAALKARMEREWAQIERSLERNPRGLRAIADAMESQDLEVGAVEDLLLEIETSSARLTALQEQTGVSARDFAIAQRQLRQGQARMLRFMERNHRVIKNPISESLETNERYYNFPAGAQVLRFFSCRVERSQQGAQVRRNQRTCEVIIGNDDLGENVRLEARRNSAGDWLGISSRVENRCLSAAPIEFFRNLFRPSRRDSAVDDSDRREEDVQTPSPQSPLPPQAVQE